MKKAILIFLAVGLTLAVKAQSNPEPTKTPPVKKEFQWDNAKPIIIQFRLSLKPFQINNYFVLENNGLARLEHATDISAAQLTAIKADHQTVVDSIQSNLSAKFTEYMAAEQKKWAADTAKKAASAVKPEKKH